MTKVFRTEPKGLTIDDYHKRVILKIVQEQDSEKADKYWKDMADRKKKQREYEDRGEPIGY